MSSTATYNGHATWNHWSVYTHLSNDADLRKLACESMERHPNRVVAARDIVDRLSRRGLRETPDGVPYRVNTVLAAMSAFCQ